MRAFAVSLFAALCGLAPAGFAANLTYISGASQVAAPGTRLPAPLVVRNDTGQPGLLLWLLPEAQGRGARFSNGQRNRLVPIGAGEVASESLTLGPDNGDVAWGACIGAFDPPTSTDLEDFQCAGTEEQGVVIVAAGTPAPGTISSAPGINYIGGSLQSGAPGSTLPVPLAVRNDAGRAQKILWLVLLDTTNGARFVAGGQRRLVPVGNGETSQQSLVLGPNPGVVGVLACRVPADLAAASVRDCGEGDELPDTAGFGLAGVVPGPALAVSGSQQAGSELRLSAPSGAARYEWDVDGDGVTDRIGSNATLPVTYASAFSGEARVRVVAANGSSTSFALPVTTLAPRLRATAAGAPVQTCGSGGTAQPGARFDVPITITNAGNAPSGADATVAFAPGDRYAAALQGAGIAGKLEVESPLVDVGVLAPGATTSATVRVALAPDASCGTTYPLLFIGAADGNGSSAGSSTPLATFAVPATCAPISCGGGASGAKAAQATAIQRRQGMYYNPARPGNGISNFVIPAGSDQVFFGAWFTAAADHTPTWYIVQGLSVGNVVVAPIFRFTRDLSSPTFRVTSTVVGSAVVTMKGAELMVFQWQIGDRSGLELMQFFVGGPVPAPNRTGAWYTPSESGWGQVVHQYVSGSENAYFIVDYLYDAAGEPRWTLGQASVAAFATSAPHQTYAVQCPGCPYLGDWLQLGAPAGTGSERLDGATNGRATTSFQLAAPLSGTWERDVPLTILTAPL